MKYQIIYADPPWKFGGTGATKWRPAKDYYNVMGFDELKSLNVEEFCDDDCLLFLWVVSSELKKCIEVGESWGFKYITVGFVWYKQRANVGNYTMSQCELCLIFKRGKIPSDRVRNPGTMQFHAEPVTVHSRKPAIFRERIESMFPHSKKIELFARDQVSGWDSWGEEVKSNVVISKKV